MFFHSLKEELWIEEMAQSPPFGNNVEFATKNTLPVFHIEKTHDFKTEYE